MEKFRGIERRRAWWRYEPIDTLIKDFYADPDRQSSDELDLGFPWRDGRPGAWSLRWLADTGELVGFHYVWAEGGWSPGNTFGPINFGADNIDEIVVLAVERDALAVQGLFADRESHIEDQDGWDWVVSVTEDRSQ